MPFIPDQRTKDDLELAPSVGRFVPDVTPDVGESYVPQPDEKAAADAQRSFDEMNRQTGQEGILTTTGQKVIPQGGQFVRPSSETNQPEFVPDYQPGYDPKEMGIYNPITGTKEKLPDWAVQFAQPIADLGIGTGKVLGQILSVIPDDIDVMMRDLTDKGLYQNPASTYELMKNYLTEKGLPTEPFDKFWGDLGETAAVQGILSLAMIAGAGPLASMGSAVKGSTAAEFSPMLRQAGSAMAKVGETAQRFPGQVLAGDLGATVAGQSAGQLSEPLQKLGLEGVITDPTVLGVLGSIVGGLTGSSLASLGRVRPGLTRGVKEGLSEAGGKFGGLPRFGGKQARDDIASGVTRDAIIPLTERTFNPAEISRAVSGYQSNVTEWIDNAMARITTGARDPAQAADRVVQMMDQAWKKARVIRNNLYSGIDQTGTFDPSSIQQAAKVLNQKVLGDAAQARFLPTAELNEILTSPEWMTKGGGQYQLGVKTPVTYTPKPISIDRARQMQDVLGSRIAEARKVPGTQKIVSNMVELSNAIGDAMDAAFPTNNALREANEFSRWMHTRFDMGSTGQFGQVRLDDANLQDSRQAMRTGMQHGKFGKGLADIGQKLGNAPAVTQRIDSYLRSTVDDLYKQAQDPLVPQDIAQANAARSAAKYMNSSDFKRLLKEFPDISTTLQQQTQQLNEELMKQLEINSSKFFKMAGTEAEKASELLVNSGSKLKDVDMILNRIGGDRGARDALVFAVTRQLGKSVNWDPVSLRNLVHSKDNIQMFSKLLGDRPGQFKRLNDVLDAMVSFQEGPVGKRSGRIIGGIKTSGRIAGLIAARFIGAKSIQSHAIGAQLGSTVLSDLFNIIPADAMLANALVDPRWERFALTKIPENMADYRRTTKLLGALVGSINAGHRELMEEQDNEK